MNKLTGNMQILGGIPIMVPNTIYADYKDFYISYNNDGRSKLAYNNDTTALVLTVGDSTSFLVLNGDHTDAYNALGNDLQACVDYFLDHPELKNHMSETPYTGFDSFDEISELKSKLDYNKDKNVLTDYLRWLKNDASKNGLIEIVNKYN